MSFEQILIDHFSPFRDRPARSRSTVLCQALDLTRFSARSDAALTCSTILLQVEQATARPVNVRVQSTRKVPEIMPCHVTRVMPGDRVNEQNVSTTFNV